MNNDLKITLENILRSRSYTYGLFHKLLGTKMTSDLLQAMTSDGTFETLSVLISEENPFATHFIKFISQYKDLSDQLVDQIGDEYTRLFVGPARLVAPPWESVYTSIDHTLFQLSTLSVRLWYQRYNYEVSTEEKSADDHIALMLHFLSLTTEKSIEHFMSDDSDKTRLILADQKRFIHQHIMSWIEKYTESMQNSSTCLFYPLLVKHLYQFILFDFELLNELITLV